MRDQHDRADDDPDQRVSRPVRTGIRTRLPQSDDLSNVTAYLGHWLKVLERDHSAIFTAASAAAKAVDFILEFSRPKEEADSETEAEAVAV